jgi:putative flippase GtrA
MLAYLIAISIGYVLQKNWSFKDRSRHETALPRYLLLQFGCMVGSGILAHFLAVFEIPAFWMSATTTFVAGVVSFVISSEWVFSEAAMRAKQSSRTRRP